VKRSRIAARFLWLLSDHSAGARSSSLTRKAFAMRAIAGFEIGDVGLGRSGGLRQRRLRHAARGAPKCERRRRG
jgi:hypothetical protein